MESLYEIIFQKIHQLQLRLVMFIYSKKYHLSVSLVVLATGFLVSLPVKALTVTSGQLIQTVHHQALLDSSSLVVNEFFRDEAMIGLLKKNIIEDMNSGSGSHQVFTYAVHSPDFKAGHPNRIVGINSFPSQFSFDPNDFMGTATKGRIGLGGVMRYSLPALADGTSRFFVLGDFTMEFNEKRKEHYNFSGKSINPSQFGVSGWLIRNHYDFPAVTYDMLNTSIMTNSDSFYMSGQFGWSRELAGGLLTGDALYKVVSDFVMCGQDDNALASNSARQIPCVFPRIKMNGQTGQVSINPGQAMMLSVDLGVATAAPINNADYFASFSHNGTMYWLNNSFQWTTAPAVAYQGGLFDFRSIVIPSPGLPIGSLPSGSEIEVFFAVDTARNGRLDGTSRTSSVIVNIR